MTRLVSLRNITDPSGSLTPLDVGDLPFALRRAWFLHDVPEGAERGGHAHRAMEEVVVAVSGSFDVLTEDVHGVHRWHLNRATKGLYIPPDEWRYLTNFSSNAIALCLASTTYDPADYIENHDAWRDSLPPMGEDYFTRRARYAHTYEDFVKVDR